MSLFGSLYTAVSGMDAQSQATSIISNNIANVNTTGFKRSDASFSALVTVESAAARYSPGSVDMNRLQRVDQQGQIQQSSSTTDVALSGGGFFTVRMENDANDEGDFLYTRNGQFTEDEEGKLVNSAGMYLYGWEVDSRDSDPNTNNSFSVFNPDLSALVPINVGLATGQSQVTTDASLGINLDADEDDVSLGAGNLVPYPNNPSYSRTLRMYDSLGSAQDVTFEYTKVFGPQAVTSSSVNGMDPSDLLISNLGLTLGDEFSLNVGGNGVEVFPVGGGGVTATTSVNDIIQFVNAYDGVGGGGGGIATASLNSNGQLDITGINFTDDILLTDTVGTPLTTLGGFTPGVPIVPAGALPTANTDGTFPDLLNLPGSGQYNPGGWWQLNIIGPNAAAPLSQGLLNFNSDGSLNANVDAQGNKDIELTGIDWGNFSDLQSIDIDIAGLSQFADFYNVAYANQNGSELGLKTSVDIDSEGYVNARFSNGKISRLYKLPIATFTSPINLQEISGTAYAESADSGSVLLQEAGVSNAGVISESTLELSNVDLAEEFTKLIITQRAYSANTKVITTVDQMTEDLLRLR